MRAITGDGNYTSLRGNWLNRLDLAQISDNRPLLVWTGLVQGKRGL
jgi:hypothetical protein